MKNPLRDVNTRCFQTKRFSGLMERKHPLGISPKPAFLFPRLYSHRKQKCWSDARWLTVAVVMSLVCWGFFHTVWLRFSHKCSCVTVKPVNYCTPSGFKLVHFHASCFYGNGSFHCTVEWGESRKCSVLRVNHLTLYSVNLENGGE